MNKPTKPTFLFAFLRVSERMALTAGYRYMLFIIIPKARDDSIEY